LPRSNIQARFFRLTKMKTNINPAAGRGAGAQRACIKAALPLKSLQETLEQDGHFVVAADGGQAGIDEFCAALRRNTPFQAVFTDLGMPNIDGRTVAAAIKSRAPTTPVILLTGWGYRLRAENDLPQHVDRVLSKPPKLYELRAALLELTAVGTPASASVSQAYP
jgi:CheY-like chemotaxis protein